MSCKYKVVITETHFGHKEGDVLDFVTRRSDDLVGDYIVAKKHLNNENLIVKADKCKVVNELDFHQKEIEVKENDVFQLKISLNNCERTYYRAYQIEGDKVIFINDQGQKTTVSKNNIDLVDLDSLFDAFTKLELEFNQMKRWLQRIFNDNVVKMLDN